MFQVIESGASKIGGGRIEGGGLDFAEYRPHLPQNVGSTSNDLKKMTYKVFERPHNTLQDESVVEGEQIHTLEVRDREVIILEIRGDSLDENAEMAVIPAVMMNVEDVNVIV